MEIVDVLSRWVHVGTAIVFLGGAVFLRFVLLPVTQRAAGGAESLQAGVLAAWRKFVHGSVALFLLSGLYNYMRAIPHHKGDGLYHGLLGGKILIALVVFFLAEALVGRSATFARWRAEPRKWWGLVILLAAIIVAISGYLKVQRPARPAVITPASQQPD